MISHRFISLSILQCHSFRDLIYNAFSLSLSFSSVPKILDTKKEKDKNRKEIESEKDDERT